MKRKEIRARFNVYQKVLGITNWRIQLHFDKPSKSKFELDKFMTVAETHVNVPYKDAAIYIHPRRLDAVDDETIIHELMHVVLAQFMQVASKKEIDLDGIDFYKEQAVSELARIVLRLINPKEYLV